MFKLDYLRCLGIILIPFVPLVLSQDRIIVFNSNFEESYANSSQGNDTIPESLLIQLRDIQNISDLLRRFVAFEDDEDDAYLLGPVRRNGTLHSPSRTNGTTSGRRGLSGVSTASIAQPANCRPEEKIIELDKPENGATLYWPSCIRVRRCGGCCTSKMLACKPTDTSVVNVTVLQMHYSHENPDRFENRGMKTFSIEQHDGCTCRCKEGIEDCNSDVHVYRENECRCICKNLEQSESCTGSRKIWDSRNCICKCRNVRLCSSGRYFNVLTCRCEILRRSLAMDNLNTQSSNSSLVF